MNMLLMQLWKMSRITIDHLLTYSELDIASSERNSDTNSIKATICTAFSMPYNKVSKLLSARMPRKERRGKDGGEVFA